MHSLISIIAPNNYTYPAWKPHTGNNNFKIADNKFLAWATDETKLFLSPSVKQRQNPCSGPLACVRGFEFAS